MFNCIGGVGIVGNMNSSSHQFTHYLIIVAGGKGLRMGGDIPKQFLPLCGKPVLMHTIERFRAWNAELKIILVLPRDQHHYWQRLCKEYHFEVEYMLADGGETRFHSVQSGLSLIPDDAQGVVGVHDGVRPLVSEEVISRCYEAAKVHEAVVPVTSVVETLRQIQADGTGKNVQRSDYRLVQTPQTFHIQLLKQAYRQPYLDAFTDDASVVEAVGRKVVMVEGNRENIKITTPFDLVVGEALLKI